MGLTTVGVILFAKTTKTHLIPAKSQTFLIKQFTFFNWVVFVSFSPWPFMYDWVEQWWNCADELHCHGIKIEQYFSYSLLMWLWLLRQGSCWSCFLLFILCKIIRLFSVYLRLDGMPYWVYQPWLSIMPLLRATNEVIPLHPSR